MNGEQPQSFISPLELSPAADLCRALPSPPVTVSVLLSTYAGETPANLEASLQSLANQSVVPEQLVLVLDGPVDENQQAIIRHFAEDDVFPSMMVVRLPMLRGLASALNAGLPYCTGTYTMRMDSDDLCAPDRVELQLAFARAHPDTDVITSWSEEFFKDGAPPKLKVSPVDHASIITALRWRNVLVHPTVLIKTETLRRIGGYRTEFGKLEDYDLFVRLALCGAKFHVIPKVLVRVRSGIGQRGRRGGFGYALSEIRFRAACFRAGFLNLGEFVLLTALYTGFRLVSNPIRRRLYSIARI